MRFVPLICLLIIANSCSDKVKVPEDETGGDTALSVKKPQIDRVFNEDSAYGHIVKQLEFGPRVPGTIAHKRCHDYMVRFLKPLADTIYLQNSSARTYDGKMIPVMNVIASFNKTASRRILLCAHWDTRPFADQDIKDREKPIPGANDGGSGVGVLLEIASALKKQPLDIGVDIILFDAEDWGDNSGRTEDSYCLGSQYWGKNPHIPQYKADFGILLDMVGAPGALFGFEGYSLSEAQTYLSMVWTAAAEAGYGQYFKNFQRGHVTDDHFYVMKYRQIPMIDIIDTDPGTESHFGKYWHTHNDNIDAIDKKTLKAVGQTVLNVLSAY